MEDNGDKGKRNEEESKDNQQRNLPDDLIFQHILPFLPIKSLTQFKVISKDWYSSISCPNFIQNHYKFSLFSQPSCPLELLLIQSGKSYYLYFCDHNNVEVTSSSDNKPVKLDVTFDVELNDEIKLVGSSNGLVCLAETYGNYFILWNPATNQSQKYYPDDCQLIKSSGYRQFVHWGFGYVSSLDDHKVVRMMRYWNGEFIAVYVYSMRLDRWRKIEFSLGECCLYGRARLVNETLYWTAYIIGGRTGSRKVIAFDLVLETFYMFPHLVISGFNDILCVMGGCLSLCTTSSSQTDLIIDIVKHPRRVVSVRLSCDLSIRNCDDLIGFTKTGKILVAYAYPRMLCWVDISTKQFPFTVTDVKQRTLVDSYVPSQTSPFPILQQK